MGSALRVATIGAWGHYGAPLSEMEGMPEIEVVALAKAHVGEEPETLRRFACVRDDAPVYDDHREMLQSVNPDVALISTRLDLLNPCALEALEAGCHVICEKPLAATSADFDRLCQALRAAGRRCLCTMSGNAGHPCLLAVRQLVEAGTLGAVVQVNARKSYPWSDDRPQRFPRALGGLIGWVGVHALSYIRAATGARFLSVVGMEGHRLNPEAFGHCPDHCGLVLALSDGAHATVSLDYHRPRGAPTHGDDWLRVVGTKATVETHLALNTFRLTTATEADASVTLPEPLLVYRQFLRSLKGDAPAEVATALSEEILDLTRASLCAQEAVDARHAVSIPAGPWLTEA